MEMNDLSFFILSPLSVFINLILFRLSPHYHIFDANLFYNLFDITSLRCLATPKFSVFHINCSFYTVRSMRMINWFHKYCGMCAKNYKFASPLSSMSFFACLLGVLILFSIQKWHTTSPLKLCSESVSNTYMRSHARKSRTCQRSGVLSL